ncbi:MAG TPA: DNA polymerase III subunit delta [Verrucomicrobiota bacterium]|nr:DNA polymerase III subunit delta [Verrucomicrobiota bacterium]
MTEPVEGSSAERSDNLRRSRKATKPAGEPAPPVVLVAGADEFTVKRRARQLFDEWQKDTGGIDNEIIDADTRTVGDALKAISRTTEALQTLPLFTTTKVVWMRNCSFLSPEKPGRSNAVSPLEQPLVNFAAFLRSFQWTNVRLLISGGPIDPKAPLASTIREIGKVEIFDGLSAADRDWAEQAEQFVRAELEARKQQIDDDALGALVAAVGPNLRQLATEAEKVSLHAGTRSRITSADVAAVVSRQKQTQAFGLAEALGDRDLPAALRHLDDELWQTQIKSDHSSLSILYSLVAKLRAMLLMKELQKAGFISPRTSYQQFKFRLEQVPTDLLAENPKFNPLKAHPYTLFKASLQTANYSFEELVNGLEILLDCNRKLVGSQLDEAAVLQSAVVKIIGVQKRSGGRRTGDRNF